MHVGYCILASGGWRLRL